MPLAFPCPACVPLTPYVPAPGPCPAEYPLPSTLIDPSFVNDTKLNVAGCVEYVERMPVGVMVVSPRLLTVVVVLAE